MKIPDQKIRITLEIDLIEFHKGMEVTKEGLKDPHYQLRLMGLASAIGMMLYNTEGQEIAKEVLDSFGTKVISRVEI